jgi:hypothetical protein
MTKTTLLFLLSFFFLNGTAALAQEANKTKNDPELILKQADNYGEKVVQISFDGVDASIGQLEITDNTNRVLKLIPEFEIVKTPYYSAINVAEFKSGEYTFTLKTKIHSYSTTITIQ